MAKWIIKTALQRAISWLPQSHRWNALFQNHFTHSIKLGLGTLQNRAEYCTKTLDAYFTSGKPLSPGELQVLEVGTGWYPVIPVAFYLCGAGKISTFDIAPLLSANRVKEALNLFLE